MRRFVSFSVVPSLLAALALLTLGCGGDEFVPAPSASGGTAGSAGAAGASVGGAAGATGTPGGAAGAPLGGAGGASGGQAGAGGANGGAGGSVAGAGGASAGAAGNAGTAGNGGVAGASSLPPIGAVSLKMFPDKSCTGDTYKNPDNGISLPQGAGDVCVMLTGNFLEGDTVKIDGDIQQKKLGNGILTVTWQVPHGGGLDKRSVTLEIIRGSDSTKLSFEITPRTASESGNDTLGVGTPQRPWKTLQKALAGATKDTIALFGKIDPGTPDPNVTAFEIPAGATVIAGAGGTASLQPLVPFALGDGARIAKLTIDCEKVLGPCVQPAAGGSTVEDVVLTAKEGGYAVLKSGVKLTVSGGKVTSPAAFLHTGAGSTLRLIAVHAVGPAGGPCTNALRVSTQQGASAPVIDMDPGAGPSRFESFRECVPIFFDGAVEGALQNAIVVDGGSAGGASPAVAVLASDSKTSVRNLVVENARATALIVQGSNLALEDVRVVSPANAGIIMLPGTYRSRGLEVTDAKVAGIGVQEGAKLSARGKIRIAWAPNTPVARPEDNAEGGMSIYGELEQLADGEMPVLLIEDAPMVSLEARGKVKLVGKQQGGDGLRILRAKTTAIRFGDKSSELGSVSFSFSSTFGVVDSTPQVAGGPPILDARFGKGNASFVNPLITVNGFVAADGTIGVPFAPPAGTYTNGPAPAPRSYSASSLMPPPQVTNVLEVSEVGDTSGDASVMFSYPP